MKLEEGFNQKEYVLFDENIKIHPDATIGKGSTIGNNTTIHYSTLGLVKIGENCIVGNYALVEDDVEIGDNSKVADKPATAQHTVHFFINPLQFFQTIATQR